MKAIQLINGKFYENGKEVKPEIGNVEQIRLLKEAEQKENMGIVKAFLTEGEIIKYYPIIHFTCPKCGTDNHEEMEDEASEWFVDNSDVSMMDIHCHSCSAMFEVEAIEGHPMGIQLRYEEE